jgi:hypothetical protein
MQGYYKLLTVMQYDSFTATRLQLQLKNFDSEGRLESHAAHTICRAKRSLGLWVALCA